MSTRWLVGILTAWIVATTVASTGVYHWTYIAPAEGPSRETSRWTLRALRQMRDGRTPPAPSEAVRSYRAAGPIYVTAWWRGRPVADHRGPPDLVDAVRGAMDRFARHETLDAIRERSTSRARPRFTVEVPLGYGPVVERIPYVSSLALVPLRDGLVATFDGRQAALTPEELRASGAYDAGVQTPVPDLSFGVDLRSLVARLARELGISVERLRAEGTVRRFRSKTLSRTSYPKETAVSEKALRRAAVEGADFLLRHQHPNGRYAYVYDGSADARRSAGYSLTRHAGTTWFLALVDKLHDMPRARRGALSALRWVREGFTRECGDDERWCVGEGKRVRAGASALTAVAAAEVLEGGEDRFVRKMLKRLTAFLRSLQREDGQLMHEYDLERGRPVDIQHMYYSGEAALALLKAHAITDDERDLRAARRLMKHLTGEGWDFLGSRYYYGEEHWTCIAAGEAAGRIDTRQALDFCRRWAQFNRRLQYGHGETPWDVRGAYGVGPVLLPRLTPVGSRTEAFISTYELSKDSTAGRAALRKQIERGLSMLLRWQWAPGPAHALADPANARGAIPATPASLHARNDFVQHAGSALIRWADVLRREGP